jgi:hypothetical protein
LAKLKIQKIPNKLAPTRHFSSVKKARESLKEKAAEVLQKYLQAIDMAAASGKYEEALKAYQWLLDHVPAEDGTRIFDSSSDKQLIIDNGPKGPVINIGFAVGSIAEPKVIEASKVIDIDE